MPKGVATAEIKPLSGIPRLLNTGFCTAMLMREIWPFVRVSDLASAQPSQNGNKQEEIPIVFNIKIGDLNG